MYNLKYLRSILFQRGKIEELLNKLKSKDHLTSMSTFNMISQYLVFSYE